MGQIVQHKQGGAWICRMCDLQACGRGAGNCPAANAAAIKYGTVLGRGHGLVPEVVEQSHLVAEVRAGGPRR
jgi:hypothetical protein